MNEQKPDLKPSINQIPSISGKAIQIREEGIYVDAPMASGLPTANNLVELGEFTEVGYGSDPEYPAVLLLLPEDVEAQEVEALAVSLWETAGWVGPGLLRLTVGENEGKPLLARLQGPWQVYKSTAQRYGFPLWTRRIFALEAPIQRTAKPVAKKFQGISPITDAFLNGEPWGLERQVINGMWAMARRLGGALFIHDGARTKTKAQLLQPDPDGAIGLTVYSSLWLSYQQLQALLQPLFSTVYNPDLPTSNPKLTPDDGPKGFFNGLNNPVTNRQSDQLLISQAEEWVKTIIPAQELAQINAESEAFAQATAWAKAQAPAPESQYRLLVEKTRGQQISVEVDPTPWLPPVLRWENWASQNCVSYALNWQTLIDERKNLTRSQRVARLRVAEQIELIAQTLIGTLGGAVVDLDGFLVNL